MPELPEVEVLRRHLEPLLSGKRVRAVEVRREKILRPTSSPELQRTLVGATFVGLSRRGKYLLFHLRRPGNQRFTMLGHLGMTGRMYLLPRQAPLPKHAAVIFNLGNRKFVFEDTRYFGRLILDSTPLEQLGPEPLDSAEPPPQFVARLRRSTRAVKVCLLDQSLVAGVGNIYASEALFRAEISPRLAGRRLTEQQVRKLWKAVRQVLAYAIERGSTVPLNFGPANDPGRLFYFGREPGAEDFYEERLHVYDRAGSACRKCGSQIRRLVQAARSTFYCPQCQQSRIRTKSASTAAKPTPGGGSSSVR